MSTLASEIEKQLPALEPEAALHFERAVREMLLLAQRGKPVPAAKSGASLPAFSMGAFKPGIDPHKLGQLPDDF
jgi:hypothetical protein